MVNITHPSLYSRTYLDTHIRLDLHSDPDQFYNPPVDGDSNTVIGVSSQTCLPLRYSGSLLYFDSILYADLGRLFPL